MTQDLLFFSHFLKILSHLFGITKKHNVVFGKTHRVIQLHSTEYFSYRMQQLNIFLFGTIKTNKN